MTGGWTAAGGPGDGAARWGRAGDRQQRGPQGRHEDRARGPSVAWPVRQDRRRVVTVTTVWADERLYYPVHAVPYTPARHFAKGRNDPAFRTKLQGGRR